MKQDLFVCPRCQTTLERSASDRVTCPQDGLEFWKVDGIWRFLLPESEAHYARFIADYESIRRSEGRGSTSADYYRALPFKDLSGLYRGDWRIRARSYNVLVKNVLTRLQNPLERSLKILDLGAGNGWLSNQLSAQGDRVIAVDLLLNEKDGLGAWKYYEHSFTPVQAEFFTPDIRQVSELMKEVQAQCGKDRGFFVGQLFLRLPQIGSSNNQMKFGWFAPAEHRGDQGTEHPAQAIERGNESPFEVQFLGQFL